MNRVYVKESVLTSCWYLKFLCPGTVRDGTHALSSSDCFGELWHWFRMPLAKEEELTGILLDKNAIQVPRSLKFQEEFEERAELLVMSALYHLGTGSSFRACRALYNISVAEICRKYTLAMGV
jgi:hypothetical protein